MANKVAPKISSPGSIKMPTKGGRNATTNAGTHGSGQTGLARVKSAGKGPAIASNLPLRTNAMRNQQGAKIGQPNPQTKAAATTKPKRKGLGSAFYGEY